LAPANDANGVVARGSAVGRVKDAALVVEERITHSNASRRGSPLQVVLVRIRVLPLSIDPTLVSNASLWLTVVLARAPRCGLTTGVAVVGLAQDIVAGEIVKGSVLTAALATVMAC